MFKITLSDNNTKNAITEHYLLEFLFLLKFKFLSSINFQNIFTIIYLSYLVAT